MIHIIKQDKDMIEKQIKQKGSEKVELPTGSVLPPVSLMVVSCNF
jgi:hypothetical protein